MVLLSSHCGCFDAGVPDDDGIFVSAEKYGGTGYWKTGIPALLFCWIAVILFGTVGTRTEGVGAQEPILIPFYSYYKAFTAGPRELLRESFMNVLLFYPAGLLGCACLPKR